MTKESNIEQRKDGLYEKSTGRKIESPLSTRVETYKKMRDKEFLKIKDILSLEGLNSKKL